MHLKKMLLRLLSCVVCLVVVLSLPFAALAEDISAKISIRTVKWSANDKKYVDTSNFASGDEIYLVLNVADIQNQKIGGYSFTAKYDPSVLTYNKDSSFCAISDSNADFNSNDISSTINVTWETASTNTVVSGDFVYLKFSVKQGLTVSKAASFEFSMKELYSSSAKFPDIAFSVINNSVMFNVTCDEIPQQLIALLNNLKDITVNSLNDITNAEAAFNALTNSQKNALSVNYPTEYGFLSTARTRYNKAITQATLDEINSIISNYSQKYSNVLNLTVETVGVSDQSKIIEAQSAYGTLSATVTSRMDRNLPKLFTALLSQIDDLNQADKEVSDFIKAYAYLFLLNDTQLDIGLNTYYLVIDEAAMVYATISPTAQNQLTSQLASLKALQDKCDVLLANNAEESALREKIVDFQKKWIYVFTLNSGNVSIEDKSAIKMVIAEYESLTDSKLKERLSSRINNLNNFLTIIDRMQKDDEAESTVDNGVPVTSDTQAPTDTDTVKETFVPVTNTVKETVIETVTSFFDKGFTKIMLVLFSLLGASILLLVVPVSLFVLYKKKLKFMDGKSEYSGGEI